MRLEKASHKAIKYACMNFHYAKRVPVNTAGYSVFNDKKKWCGVVVFGAGVEGIEKPYHLPKNTVWELVRVALNGQHGTTTKTVSTSVRLFKKDAPTVKLLVSYADSDQSHNGTIYQAMNWFFVGSNRTSDRYICKKTGKDIHSRQISKSGMKQQFGTKKRCYTYEDVEKIKTGVKHKYIYPLDKSLVPMCKALSKPYPKKEQNAAIAQAEHTTSGGEMACQTDLAAPIIEGGKL